MNEPILITSFRPWRVHQRSNSSDDLVAAMQVSGQMPPDAIWLRHLPVSFELAPIQVKNEIWRSRPRAVICCGMAEKRTQLSVERLAKRHDSQPFIGKRYVDEQSDEGFSNPQESVRQTAVPQIFVRQISTLETSMNVDELIANTLLSNISEDAGTYVCNHLYYNVLDLVGSVNWRMSGVFIHIPILNSDNKTVLLQDFVQIVGKIAGGLC